MILTTTRILFRMPYFSRLLYRRKSTYARLIHYNLSIVLRGAPVVARSRLYRYIILMAGRALFRDCDVTWSPVYYNIPSPVSRPDDRRQKNYTYVLFWAVKSVLYEDYSVGTHAGLLSALRLPFYCAFVLMFCVIVKTFRRLTGSVW